MPSYVRWIRRAKEALHSGDKERADDIRSRLDHTPELWASILREFEEEKKAKAVKKAPTKKAPAKSAPKKKKIKNEK
jgi:hypothetical protein